MKIKLRVKRLSEDESEVQSTEIDTEILGFEKGLSVTYYSDMYVEKLNEGLTEGEEPIEWISADEIKDEDFEDVETGEVSFDQNIINILEKGEFPVKITNPERRVQGRATCLRLIVGETETIIEPGQEIIIGIPEDDILTLTPMEK